MQKVFEGLCTVEPLAQLVAAGVMHQVMAYVYYIQTAKPIAPVLTLKSDRVQYDQFKEAQPVKGLPGGTMQAYKLKGAIDQSGHLIITEPIDLSPGEVEIIVLRQSPTEDKSVSADETQTATPQKRKTSVKVFQDLFENTEPAPPDFDPEQARWEALKEKHNL